MPRTAIIAGLALLTLAAVVTVLLVVVNTGGSDSGQRAAPGSSAQRTETGRGTRSEGGSARGSWSYAQLIRRLDGEAVTVAGKRVALDPGLLTCNGEGRGTPADGGRRWGRFTCTQTTFRGGVDRDITFEVVVLGDGNFRFANARYGPD
ncbi:MAG TPA: hypothetical protein VE780_04465 [Thermoleophilaceae bacterium]|jgi:hypothetical protein|nr:hypothetical protein [Thermoleophilaceae bacterium]